MKRTLIAFLPLALWAAAVLVVGGLDLGLQSSLPTGSDKLGHFIMYGAGGALAGWAGWRAGGRSGMWALVFVIATGAVDELHQATVPTRTADPLDWLVDAVGATLLYALTGRLLNRNPSE